LEFRSSSDYGPDPTRMDGWTSDGDVRGNGLVIWQIKTAGPYREGPFERIQLAGSPGLHIAPGLMLIGAVMLVAGFGAPALWISVITVGIALTAIEITRSHHSVGS
jgi:hypothetical protein